MAMFDVSSILSTMTWSEEQLYLKEFVHKHDLPVVVRIVKGQYLNLGVASLSNPSLHSTVLIMNMGKKKRIIGQSVKFKENHKVVLVGPKIAIPSGFEGFFEILSEDGRSVKCIESISELVKRFPDSVLVRENVRAFVSRSDDLNTIHEKSRIVEVGETLILVGEVGGSLSNGSVAKYLRCLDKNGENIYLSTELKGKFSAIAKEDNISGVHSVENLLNKRLPLMARLVHGNSPLGSKNSQQFTTEMRLFAGIEEECLVAMTLSSSSKEPQILSLPLPALIKIQYVTNMSSLTNSKEYQRLIDKCQDLGQSMEDKIHIHDVSFVGHDLKLNGIDVKQRVNMMQNPKQFRVISSMNKLSGNQNSYPSQIGNDYDEIEQIYDYVRGFAPLPKGARGWKYEPPRFEEQPHQSLLQDDALEKSSDPPSPHNGPPEPPPLETLPSRKSFCSPGDQTYLWSGTYGHIPDHVPSLTENIYSSCSVHFGNNNKLNNFFNKPEAKKRQRRSEEKSYENRCPSDTHHLLSNQITVSSSPAGMENTSAITTRFIKSANYKNPQNSIGFKLKFFRSKSSKEIPISPATLRRSSILDGGGFSIYGQGSISQPHGGKLLTGSSAVFNMRYKSMTNLATTGTSGSIEYDTLDSTSSGGKTMSGDSGGGSSSRNQLPEKRSRKLSRPKSLTNLVWSGLKTSSSKQCLNNISGENSDQKKRLDPGVFIHKRLSRDFHLGPTQVNSLVTPNAHSKKMGGSKRIGTLYL